MNEQQERSAFERWYEGYCLPGEADWFRRDADDPDEYKHGHTSEAWAGWQARAALAANEKQPNRATDIATALALPGCERLREWAEIGPVQRAAVEEFVYALAANVPADPVATMRELGFRFALDDDLRQKADKIASLLRGSRANYQVEQEAAALIWLMRDALAAAPTPEADAWRNRWPSTAAVHPDAPAQAQQSSEPYTYERQKAGFEVWAKRIGLRLDRWRIHPDFCDQAEAETWAAWQAWKDSPGHCVD